MQLDQIVKGFEDKIIKTRRDLHRIPEPAFTERKTSEYVAEYLGNEGLKVETGIAQYGVTALLETGSPGPTLMIRSDMDALYVKEETSLPFSSVHEGAMHACGHDGHMAMVLGAASLLNAVREELTGNIKFIFQPAEEGPGGAKPMIDAGVMENPKVDYSVGCHIWPAIPQGQIGVKAGPLMAALDRFDIEINGKGGHGAMPHLCVDALEIATRVVGAFQQIVSRQMNPLSPTVVTVGQMHAGTAYNVIAEKATLNGTTRTFDKEIWNSWEDRLDRAIRGVCEPAGATYRLDFAKGYPPTVNDPEMTETVRSCAIESVGMENVIEPESTMGGEDMAFYLEKSKGCFFFLGCGREGSAPIHNSRFDFDEQILARGVEIYGRIALDLLHKNRAE